MNSYPFKLKDENRSSALKADMVKFLNGQKFIMLAMRGQIIEVQFHEMPKEVKKDA